MSEHQKTTSETCQHEVEGFYHGRTEFGVGQHDQIRTRLNEELHSEYGDYLVKEQSDRVRKTEEDGERRTVYGYESSTGSAADIGYESTMSIVNKQKQLNEDRKVEHAADLATKAGQNFQQDGSGDASRMSTEDAREESNMVSSYGSSESFESFDEREQRQHDDYSEALREQIEEKKKITETNKKKQDLEDEKNEWVGGSRKHFNFDSASKGYSGSSQSSEKGEMDERSQKQQDYSDALRDQIAEKKNITDGIKKKQDFEDARSDRAHAGCQYFNTESRNAVSPYGSSESLESFDEREQRQHEYSEALREQIEEDKKITETNKKKQDFEDERNEWVGGSRKHFNFDTASSEHEEWDARSQKQQDYSDELGDQIAEKKYITDGIKEKQDFEDARSVKDHAGCQYFDTESRSMKGYSGYSESSEQDEHDKRRQKQREYAEELRQQIVEKKKITDGIKKKQDLEDDRNDQRAEESCKPVPHYFNSESPNQTANYADSEIYEQEELDERRQKQHDYADALRDQIAEKKTITDGIKKKEDEEDERNDLAQGSTHDYHSGSYGSS